MRALLIKEHSLEMYIGSCDEPVLGDDELLVQVKATALNRSDLLQKRGLYPPPQGASSIIGLEMAGVVQETGDNVEGWKHGDRVFGLLPGGGYAEQVTIPSNMAMKIPKNLSFEEAAAIPEAFLTAYLNMIVLGKVKKEETVLIHAGASGVGSAAIQLAREVNAKTIITAGSTKKLAFCRSLGANVLVNYNQQSFSDVVLEATHNQGVQLVLDFIGASYWEQNMESLALDGRWVIIGVLGGYEKTINLRQLMRKRATIIGTTLRSRSNKDKTDIVKQFSAFALPRFRDGRLKPLIDSVFSWKHGENAHHYMEENKNTGKIILKID